MTLTTALLILVPTNIATLVGGYFWGRKVRAVVQIGEAMSDDTGTRTQPSAPRWMYFLAVVVVLIGAAQVFLGVMVVGSESRQDRLVSCVAGYSNASAKAARARSSATNTVFAQIDAVFAEVQTVFDTAPADARERVRAAIKAYNESRQKARQAQKDNPLPESPQNACAELLD
jgi:hypothetical protein